jgi:hypothetical protein
MTDDQTQSIEKIVEIMQLYRAGVGRPSAKRVIAEYVDALSPQDKATLIFMLDVLHIKPRKKWWQFWRRG